MSARTRPDRDDARVARVPLDRLRAHPRNVRHDLGDLRELTASIADAGVLVPLMAERRGDVLQLLHGHRRAAAARLAGLRSVPCVVVEAHAEDEAIALMIAENGPTRRGLSPQEKRDAVIALHDEFGYSYAEVAERFAVSTATVLAWRRAAGGDDRADEGRPPELPRSPQPADPVDEVAVGAVLDGRVPLGKVSPRSQDAVLARLDRDGVGPAAAARRLDVELRQVQRIRRRSGLAVDDQRRKAGSHVVSKRKLDEVLDRWDGHAPPALLAQLRDLTGARDNVTSLDGRRVTG